MLTEFGSARCAYLVISVEVKIAAATVFLASIEDSVGIAVRAIGIARRAIGDVATVCDLIFIAVELALIRDPVACAVSAGRVIRRAVSDVTTVANAIPIAVRFASVGNAIAVAVGTISVARLTIRDFDPVANSIMVAIAVGRVFRGAVAGKITEIDFAWNQGGDRNVVVGRQRSVFHECLNDIAVKANRVKTPGIDWNIKHQSPCVRRAEILQEITRRVRCGAVSIIERAGV